MSTNTLLTPVRLTNGTIIKNRFVKAAMNEAMGTQHLQPKAEIVHLYQEWAKGGSGLIITGNVMVDPNYLAEPGNVVFNDDSDRQLLEAWARAGQENGAKIMVQINHPGKQAPKTVSKEPVAPSAVPISGSVGSFFNAPRALTIVEIHHIVQQFATAARIAKETGFNGVEIHAAHGYLISQFLSPFDNRRSDEYGGSLENRMRFLKEIYLAMRQQVGHDFPIGLKINSTDFRTDGFTEADSIAVVKEMDDLGIDFVEVSGGSYENPQMTSATSKDKPTVFFADYSQRLKTQIQAPVIVTGGIRSAASMVSIITDGVADFVGLARPLAMNPQLPNHIAAGTYKTVETQRVSTGIAKLDRKIGSLLGLVYYQLMMQTIAKGKVPKLTKNAWPALCHAVYHQGLAALFPQRAK